MVTICLRKREIFNFFEAPEVASALDVRGSASRLIEACSQLAISLQAPQESAAIDVFVRSYTDFHTAVTQAIKQQQVQSFLSEHIC